nr:MAG TPA: hypothetical protein [Caudoviricetes sp.]
MGIIPYLFFFFVKVLFFDCILYRCKEHERCSIAIVL